MKLLILGGTRFLGRHVAERAIALGHRVTLFHRGRTMPNGLPGTTSVIGDRAGDVAQLTGEFDAVVDTSGYLPRDVAASSTRLHELAPACVYAFVSSINAYRDGLPAGADESAPLWENGDPEASEMTAETYGPLKALCEAAVLARFGAGALIVRPGLIVGPYDPTDRFTYWVRRIARGGTVLAPDALDRPVQFVDARDLAEWILTMLQSRRGGTFNATGPPEPLSFGAFLAACATALKSDASFAWAPQDFLLERGIEPWTQMPLWTGEDEAVGWDSISSARAVANGLKYRTLVQTIADTARWDAARGEGDLRAGITRERERQLLHELHGSE